MQNYELCDNADQRHPSGTELKKNLQGVATWERGVRFINHLGMTVIQNLWIWSVKLQRFVASPSGFADSVKSDSEGKDPTGDQRKNMSLITKKGDFIWLLQEEKT